MKRVPDPQMTTDNVMQGIARGVDHLVNPHGFVVLVMVDDGKGGTGVNYVSNRKREDIVVALKEMLARFEGRVHPAGRA